MILPNLFKYDSSILFFWQSIPNFILVFKTIKSFNRSGINPSQHKKHPFQNEKEYFFSHFFQIFNLKFTNNIFITNFLFQSNDIHYKCIIIYLKQIIAWESPFQIKFCFYSLGISIRIKIKIFSNFMSPKPLL